MSNNISLREGSNSRQMRRKGWNSLHNQMALVRKRDALSHPRGHQFNKKALKPKAVEASSQRQLLEPHQTKSIAIACIFFNLGNGRVR